MLQSTFDPKDEMNAIEEEEKTHNVLFKGRIVSV